MNIENQKLNNHHSQNQYINQNNGKHIFGSKLFFDGFYIEKRYPFNLSESVYYNKPNLKIENCTLCHNSTQGNTVPLPGFKDYNALYNIDSIFNNHHIISHIQHKKRNSIANIFNFLSIAKKHSEYSILSDGFYIPNFKKSHNYFHLLKREQLPIEKDLESDIFKHTINKSSSGQINILKNYLRSGIVITSMSMEWVEKIYFAIEKIFGRSYMLGKMPYFNLICSYNNKEWTLIIFPRIVQRPTQYYEINNMAKIKIVPGAIEMGGIFPVSSEKEAIKLTPDLIKNIYTQVSYSFNHLMELLKPLDTTRI